MTTTAVSPQEWSELSGLIARTMGLHFPPARLDDLQRGLDGAASELGFDDTGACVRQLLGATPDKTQLLALASHLTIGETYFFRDRPMLDALAQTILPELIASRRGRTQRLRIWSAACASGEEAYSLAILLQQALPDVDDWQVAITATDINPRALHKAAVGHYGPWSFRNVPAGIKERYFERAPDGRHAIAPRIKKLVTFEHLNLVQDAYPSLATDTNAMDIILCRNVLMYFTPEQIRKVVGNLHHALVDGGWLAVSPSETSQALFAQFATVNFPGAVFYRKSAAPAPSRQPVPAAPLAEVAGQGAPVAPVVPGPAPAIETARVRTLPPSPRVLAQSLFDQGRYEEAAQTLVDSFVRRAPDSQAFSLLARALSNQGRLDQALAWCDRWTAVDKMDPAGHYLRAVVLLEQGQHEQAMLSLRRAIYLEPELVLAHFALGNLARRQGRTQEAARHFANTADLLRRYQPGDALPQSDGLSADALARTLAAIAGVDASP